MQCSASVGTVFSPAGAVACHTRAESESEHSFHGMTTRYCGLQDKVAKSKIKDKGAIHVDVEGKVGRRAARCVAEW